MQTIPALMTLVRNHDRWDTGNAYVDGHGRVRCHKAGGVEAGLNYIDYGLSVVSANVVSECIPHGAVSDQAELLYELGEHGLMGGFEVSERFYEVGSDSGIADLEEMLARGTGAHRP
jgi:hypothetical protein